VETSKECNKCFEVKRVDEFYRNKGMPDGRLNQCKVCHQAARKKYYEKNAAKINEKTAAYHRKNREALLAQKKAWRENNRDSIVEYKKQYRAENAEEISQYRKTYWLNNPEMRRKHDERRKVRERGSFVSDVSSDQKLEKLKIYGHLCAYCGCDLKGSVIHWDHWKPLSKGGLHMLSNLYPSCVACNLSKAAKWPFKKPMNFSEAVML
jgi:5-methylcytosine-specific restriction endonuclease McrA